MKTEYKTKTKDNINIALDHYKCGHDEVLIFAPGWCMTKDSNAFSRISESFSSDFDIITFDFRGHGKSGGFYTFTAREIIDFDAVVRYARRCGYKRIYAAGFSLGGAMALIYASKSIKVDKVIAVSAPCDFSRIENRMWKRAAWLETFKKFELSRFLSIRPYPIPLKKVKPIDIIGRVKVPTLFVAGGKDPTVCSWHTKLLYDTALCKKKYKEYEMGFHAEDLFLYYEADFRKLCFDWLKFTQ